MLPQYAFDELLIKNLFDHLLVCVWSPKTSTLLHPHDLQAVLEIVCFETAKQFRSKEDNKSNVRASMHGEPSYFGSPIGTEENKVMNGTTEFPSSHLHIFTTSYLG